MYGVCSHCKCSFETLQGFNHHACMTEAMDLSRLELATQLFIRGKMSEKTYKKVLAEETR